MAIHGQVCFHRWLFANRVKPHWCITGPVVPLGCTNQSWCGVKLLTMSVSTHPVGCVHICHLLRGQHYSMHANGKFFPPPACHPPPPPHPHPPPTCPPPIQCIRDITWAIKNYLKTRLCVIHGRDSYWMIAIIQLYLYGKSCVAIV